MYIVDVHVGCKHMVYATHSNEGGREGKKDNCYGKTTHVSLQLFECISSADREKKASK